MPLKFYGLEPFGDVSQASSERENLVRLFVTRSDMSYLELCAESVHVLRGGHRRMRSCLNCVLLSWKSESVPSHGV